MTAKTSDHYKARLYASLWGTSPRFEELKTALCEYGQNTQTNCNLLQSILQKADHAIRHKQPISQPIEGLSLYCDGENYYAYLDENTFSLTLKTRAGKPIWSEIPKSKPLDLPTACPEAAPVARHEARPIASQAGDPKVSQICKSDCQFLEMTQDLTKRKAQTLAKTGISIVGTLPASI